MQSWAFLWALWIYFGPTLFSCEKFWNILQDNAMLSPCSPHDITYFYRTMALENGYRK